MEPDNTGTALLQPLTAGHINRLSRLRDAWNSRLSATAPPAPEWAEHPALAEAWAASRWKSAAQGGPTWRQAAESVDQQVDRGHIDALRSDVERVAAEWVAEWEQEHGPHRDEEGWAKLQDICWIQVARGADVEAEQSAELPDEWAAELAKLDALTMAREVNGLPWLSDRLWVRLNELDREAARTWREAHPPPEQTQLEGMGRRPYLWAWFPTPEKPIPYAYRMLAWAVWRGITEPRLRAEQNKSVPMLLSGRYGAAIGLGTRTLDGQVMELQTQQLPEKGARLMATGAASYPLRIEVLGYILAVLYERLNADGPTRYNSQNVPKLAIPAGTQLAAALGKAVKGSSKDKADSAVIRLAEECWAEGKEVLRWFLAERVQPAPGRPSVWIITPGELLLPVYGRPGKLVPWPDLLPDSLWAGPVNACRAAVAGAALPLIWRDAAGHENGEAWLKRPGVPIATLRERWKEYGQGLDLDAFMEAQVRKGWAYLENGNLCPSDEMMPNLTRKLQQAAEQARAAKKAGAKKPRKIATF